MCVFFFFLYMVPVKVAKLKVELREAEDDLVKALAGMSSSRNFSYECLDRCWLHTSIE